jgi:hypothetical protein
VICVNLIYNKDGNISIVLPLPASGKDGNKGKTDDKTENNDQDSEGSEDDQDGEEDPENNEDDDEEID